MLALFLTSVAFGLNHQDRLKAGVSFVPRFGRPWREVPVTRRLLAIDKDSRLGCYDGDR